MYEKKNFKVIKFVFADNSLPIPNMVFEGAFSDVI